MILPQCTPPCISLCLTWYCNYLLHLQCCSGRHDRNISQRSIMHSTCVLLISVFCSLPGTAQRVTCSVTAFVCHWFLSGVLQHMCQANSSRLPDGRSARTGGRIQATHWRRLSLWQAYEPHVQTWHRGCWFWVGVELGRLQGGLPDGMTQVTRWNDTSMTQVDVMHHQRC